MNVTRRTLWFGVAATALLTACTGSWQSTEVSGLNRISGAAPESVLHFFSGRPDGALPNVGRLVFDRAGNLYGATNTGGAGTCKFRGIFTGCGVVFELSRSRNRGWNERVIYSFKDIRDGAGPYSTLTLDRAGDIFGVTMAGGNRGCVPLFWVYRGCGTAFELIRSHNVWKKRILHVFSGGPDGGNPVTSLILDSQGNLYGTAHCGGETYSCFGEGAGDGVFFVLHYNGRGGWSEGVLHDFGQQHGDGAFPSGDLTPKGARTIFGTTNGSVYEMTRSGSSSYWQETTLFVFPTSFSEGYIAKGGIVYDAGGNLYGTTYEGGNPDCTANGCGTIFELTRAPSGTWTETVLHKFSGGADGSFPDAGLTIDSRGILYGTTTNGGDLTCNNGGGCGVVFRLNPATAPLEKVLHTFEDDAADGGMPQSTVTLDRAGNIFGSTEYGGLGSNLGKGTAFELTPK